MQTLKPISEWLKELPEPYRTQAIANCKNPNSTVISKDIALIRAFSFVYSPEGYDYWFNFLKSL